MMYTSQDRAVIRCDQVEQRATVPIPPMTVACRGILHGKPSARWHTMDAIPIGTPVWFKIDESCVILGGCLISVPVESILAWEEPDDVPTKAE